LKVEAVVGTVNIVLLLLMI